MTQEPATPAHTTPHALNLEFLRQVVGVAVDTLYDSHPEDVRRVFPRQDLANILGITMTQKDAIEDLYRQAWDMLCAPYAPGQAQASTPASGPMPVPCVTDAMVHAALATKNPALYREHLRHPANGPLTRASTEAEINITRAMIAAAMQAAAPGVGRQDPKRAVVATAPERIYLCVGRDCPDEARFGDLVDVSWSAHEVDENDICYLRSDLAGDPSRPGQGHAAPASERETGDAAVREACRNIIKALASIVNAPQTDAQVDADVLPRDPIMARVTQIRAQVDAIYRAVPAPVHPTMQYAASRGMGEA